MLQNERVVDTMWLTSTGADFYVMWKAGLQGRLEPPLARGMGNIRVMMATHPHRSVQGPRDLIVLLDARTTSQDFG